MTCGTGYTTSNDAMKLFISEKNVLVRHHHTRKSLRGRVNVGLSHERAWGSSTVTE